MATNDELTEAVVKLIQAVDELNQSIGFNRVGGLQSANRVGDLLIEAYKLVEVDDGNN